MGWLGKSWEEVKPDWLGAAVSVPGCLAFCLARWHTAGRGYGLLCCTRGYVNQSAPGTQLCPVVTPATEHSFRCWCFSCLAEVCIKRLSYAGPGTECNTILQQLQFVELNWCALFKKPNLNHT